MKNVPIFILIFLGISCSNKKTEPTDNPFLGTWRLTELEFVYESEGIDFNLSQFARYVGEDEFYEASEVEDCFRGMRLEFEENTYRFYKTVHNTYCDEDVDNDQGSYQYNANEATVTTGEIFTDGGEDSQLMRIENSQLKLISTEGEDNYLQITMIFEQD